jgi:hypothetical protein
MKLKEKLNSLGYLSKNEKNRIKKEPFKWKKKERSTISIFTKKN